MKIILDFDDTILNTGLLMKELVGIFTRAGLSEKDYYENYRRTKEIKGDFDLDLILNLSSETIDLDKKKIKNEIAILFDGMEIFVYRDFFDFCKNFSRENMILLSTGEKDFQMNKIKGSKVIPYFSEVIVISREKSEKLKVISKKYPGEDMIFVDDKAREIDRAKKLLPGLITLKMERPDGRHILPKSEFADFTVKDFHDVLSIINNQFI